MTILLLSYVTVAVLMFLAFGAGAVGVILLTEEANDPVGTGIWTVFLLLLAAVAAALWPITLPASIIAVS